MQNVFVIDSQRNPLMPCHSAKARELLKQGKAAVFRRYPFTIILKERIGGDTQPIAYKVDPGAKTTGIALVADTKHGKRVVWSAELHHRGNAIRDALLSRRQLRRTRRTRNLRYRPARFLNRRTSKGWIPPSLKSRVDNIMSWGARLYRFAPLTSISQELVRFDTQLMKNSEISGVEYQQGELQGYEVREYLLEKWQRKCAYCGKKDVPFEVEHINPRARGGSNRVSNLTLACHDCNEAKGSKTAAEFGYPNIQKQAKKPLKDAAAVNATRWSLYRALEATGLPLEVGTGGRTKFNRVRQNYPKAHWIDAACVGISGESVFIHTGMKPLTIKAKGRGKRQMCQTDKYGFPKAHRKRLKMNCGFTTGDIVKATVLKGKNAGIYTGRIIIRSVPSFSLFGFNVHPRNLICLHKSDGYEYET